VRKIFLLVFAIFVGIFPSTVVAKASNCLSLTDEMLTPMSFTISEWTSNGITKEYVDSSYRAYGNTGVEPWVKDSKYLPINLLEKLAPIPANEKNIEVWFEKASTENFQDMKRTGWAAFPSIYRPYLEVDTVVNANAGDWLRFVASIQIKDCGPPKVIRSQAAQYPMGKLPVVSIDTIKQLKMGSASSSDSRMISFEPNGISPWHFLTFESIDKNFQTLKSELGRDREIGERFLVPSVLGSQNQLRLRIDPISPSDCFGFERINIRYTNDGWDISFSKLPCTVGVFAWLPPKLFSGPQLLRDPTTSYMWDCFTCTTDVLIYSIKVNANGAVELKAKQAADAKAAAELKAKQDADAKTAADKEVFIKLQEDLAAANASLAESQKVNRDLRAQLTDVEGQLLRLSASVSTIQTEVLALNTKLTTALKSLNTANAKIKKICAAKPKPKGC
jgi:hypothetical protein